MNHDVQRLEDENNCVNINGYIFTPVVVADSFDGIVIRNPEICDCWSPKKTYSNKTLEDHIALINQNKLESACIICEDLQFITRCPSLKYIEIYIADTVLENFDYSPLYEMPEINYLMCKTQYGGVSEPYTTTIDYSKIDGLKEVWVDGEGHLNYNQLKHLESLHISTEKTKRDLNHLESLYTLSDLDICQLSIKTLEGIESLMGLKNLEISYCRSLNDVSRLSELSNTIETLSIDVCPKIKDFSFLYDMVNLESLHLWGNNVLPDLCFLEKMTKLKRFTFSMRVDNCDLSPCLKIPHVYSYRNLRQYNFKNEELPKS